MTSCHIPFHQQHVSKKEVEMGDSFIAAKVTTVHVILVLENLMQRDSLKKPTYVHR
jgi:hypothetical protein